MSEQLIPLAAAAARIHGGAPISRRTVWGWTRGGVRAPDGTQVVLRTTRVGRRLYTTSAWLDAFLAALNPEKGGATNA